MFSELIIGNALEGRDRDLFFWGGDRNFARPELEIRARQKSVS
jgi:hypothetical protein